MHAVCVCDDQRWLVVDSNPSCPAHYVFQFLNHTACYNSYLVDRVTVSILNFSYENSQKNVKGQFQKKLPVLHARPALPSSRPHSQRSRHLLTRWRELLRGDAPSVNAAFPSAE